LPKQLAVFTTCGSHEKRAFGQLPQEASSQQMPSAVMPFVLISPRPMKFEATPGKVEQRPVAASLPLGWWVGTDRRKVNRSFV
jgi:hypothetical protein